MCTTDEGDGQSFKKAEISPNDSRFSPLYNIFRKRLLQSNLVRILFEMEKKKMRIIKANQKSLKISIRLLTVQYNKEIHQIFFKKLYNANIIFGWLNLYIFLNCKYGWNSVLERKYLKLEGLKIMKVQICVSTSKYAMTMLLD